MTEIVTVQELADAKVDCQDIGDALNTKQMIKPRFGSEFESLPLAVQKVIETGGFEPFATEEELLKSTPTLTKKAAKALDTKKVWLWDGKWNDTGLSELDLAKNYTNSFDSLLINSGKAFPFKALTRNDAVSVINTDFANAILDVKVINAKPNKFYKIEFFMNGQGNASFNADGWGIYSYDKDTFATAASASGELVVDYKNPQSIIDRTSISKITLKSTLYTDLSFEIVIDGRKLPAYASKFLRSSLASDAGFSWIIDPICYELKNDNLVLKTDGVLFKAEAPRDYLYNRGEFYPFVKATFKGITSNQNTTFTNLIKDFKVENAELGYLYTLHYYTNGSEAFGTGMGERWIIRKRLASTYESETATETAIVDIKTVQATLPKTGKIEAITLKSEGREKFHLVVDTSKLPAYGTWITSSLASTTGYSWYMNQANYSYYLQEESAATTKSTQSLFTYTASTKSFTHRYLSGAYVYEIKFGVNGANSLPNFMSISRGLGDDLQKTALTTIQSFSTDWLPPLVFYAENNTDDGDSKYTFTGGNHASNGDATGDPTAFNELFLIFVDDQQIDMSKDFQSFAKNIVVKLSHKIMASNTKIQKRYALRQMFDLNFSGSSVAVHCQIKSFENIRIASDYAVQMTTVGFQSTMMFLNGDVAERVAFDQTKNSGLRSEYPEAWAVILKGTGGIQASWMDRSYGNGKPENVSPDQALIAGGGSGNSKMYHRAWRSYGAKVSFPDLLVTTTDEYKWRGGYTIQDDNTTGIFDSTLKLKEVISVIDGNTYF